MPDDCSQNDQGLRGLSAQLKKHLEILLPTCTGIGDLRREVQKIAADLGLTIWGPEFVKEGKKLRVQILGSDNEILITVTTSVTVGRFSDML